ncbi:membrane metallo-endopeptidase-like 1 [Planococcus citri]|uniref:membrane metallo-endopeptidase-like 1 n=1 Tax=Planococcus citri TaxID=170843 RepID=UPI0031F7A6A8
MLRNAEVVPNPNTHPRRNANTFIAAISNKYRILCGILLRRSTFKNVLLISIIIGTACVVGFVLVILLTAKILESINSSADPCDDFFEYACGKWSHSHFIPLQEENSWFIERKQRINYLITNLLAENSSSEIEPVLQMKQLYNMCMDTDHLNQQGLEPLYRVLDLLQLPRSFPSNETVGNFSLAKTLSLAQRILNLDIIVQLSTHFNESLNLTVLSISPASNDLFSLDRRRQKADSESDEFAEKMLAIRLAYMLGIIAEFDTGKATENDIVTEAMRIILLESQLKMDKDETTKNETEESYMTLDLLQRIMFSNISSEMSNLTELNFYWLDYVTVLTQGLNITLTMESTVQVINTSYFQKLGNRVVEFNALFFQRYVWWKVVDLLAIHTTDIMRTHKYIFEERIYHEMTKPTR